MTALRGTMPLAGRRAARRHVANCDKYASIMSMRTLYLGNVPDEVVERLERLAAQAGTSISAVAVRKLAQASRRADNPLLLERLPDLGIDPAAIVRAVEAKRVEQ
jgi:hypothetical protein